MKRRRQTVGLTAFLHSHSDRMRRVSRTAPCPICGRADWCLISPDGSAAICPRVEQGSVKECGDAGLLKGRRR